MRPALHVGRVWEMTNACRIFISILTGRVKLKDPDVDARIILKLTHLHQDMGLDSSSL